MNQVLRFLFSQFVMYNQEPSLAGGGGGGDAKPVPPAEARAFLADFADVPADLPDDKVVAWHGRVTAGMVKHGPKPTEYKPEEVKAATEFLGKNVDGFDPKDMKPDRIMGLRGAFDVWEGSEARKFLKSSGAKAEDVAKMSNADAIKAANEVKAKPVEYGDFQYPEGFVKDEESDKGFKTWLTENKVPKAAAQKLVDLYAGLAKKEAEKPYSLWQDTQKGWRETVAKDPEIGGAAQAANLASIGKMLDMVGGPKAKAIREALDYTGAGNHPEVIRLLFNLSKAYAEGGPLSGKPATLDNKGNPATALYPNQPSESAG